VLYWPNDKEIGRTPLSPSADPLSPLPVPAAVYYNGTVVADDGAVFALASGAGTTGSGVQVVKATLDGDVAAFATGSTQAIIQVGADADSLYVATGVDVTKTGSDVTTRTSRLLRVAKTNGTQKDVVDPENTSASGPSPGAALGGYLGVQSDGTSVFALYQNSAAGDAGTAMVEVRQVDPKDALPAKATTFYETPVILKDSSLSILGAVGGSVVMSRIEYGDDGSPRSSYVFVVSRPGGAQNVVKNYVGDYAVPGLAADDDRIYWMTASGEVYSLSRSAFE
jgi:hypothetical protein